MKTVRKTISVLMIAVFAVCMTGCIFATKTRDAFLKTVKSYGCEEVDNVMDLSKISSTHESTGTVYYAAKDRADADKVYKTTINRNNNLPVKDIEDILIVKAREKGETRIHEAKAYTFICCSEDDANKIFDKYTEAITKTDEKWYKQGKKWNVTYVIRYSTGSIGGTITGLYLYGNSVTTLQANFYFGEHEYNDFADHFCDKMGYVSPMTIYEPKEA